MCFTTSQWVLEVPQITDSEKDTKPSGPPCTPPVHLKIQNILFKDISNHSGIVPEVHFLVNIDINK
jgi:hypothetical protein